MRKGCEALGKCEEMISKLGLFSANETKDDISTTNLKYLLVISILSYIICIFGNYMVLCQFFFFHVIVSFPSGKVLQKGRK